MPKTMHVPVNFYNAEHMKVMPDDRMLATINCYLPKIAPHRQDRHGHIRKKLREDNFPGAKWSLSLELFRLLVESEAPLLSESLFMSTPKRKASHPRLPHKIWIDMIRADALF